MAEAGSQCWLTGHNRKDRAKERKKERATDKKNSGWEYRGIIKEMWGGRVNKYLSG